jgi:hypothetical protein
MQAQFENKFG